MSLLWPAEYNHDMSAPAQPSVASGSSLDAIIARYKLDVDRTLLRQALRLTPAQRLQTMVDLARAAEALRVAGKKAFGD